MIIISVGTNAVFYFLPTTNVLAQLPRVIIYMSAGPNLGRGKRGKRGSCPGPRFSEGPRPRFDNFLFFTHKLNVPPQIGYRYRPVPDQVDGHRAFIGAPRIWSVTTPPSSPRRRPSRQATGPAPARSQILPRAPHSLSSALGECWTEAYMIV